MIRPHHACLVDAEKELFASIQNSYKIETLFHLHYNLTIEYFALIFFFLLFFPPRFYFITTIKEQKHLRKAWMHLGYDKSLSSGLDFLNLKAGCCNHSFLKEKLFALNSLLEENGFTIFGCARTPRQLPGGENIK
uniref:Uncharacterized protein n=1 Tax=Anguilla anguilla TaxID=7936 RepID=A0A0E9WXP1_ANGAN